MLHCARAGKRKKEERGGGGSLCLVAPFSLSPLSLLAAAPSLSPPPSPAMQLSLAPRPVATPVSRRGAVVARAAAPSNEAPSRRAALAALAGGEFEVERERETKKKKKSSQRGERVGKRESAAAGVGGAGAARLAPRPMPAQIREGQHLFGQCPPSLGMERGKKGAQGVAGLPCPLPRSCGAIAPPSSPSRLSPRPPPPFQPSPWPSLPRPPTPSRSPPRRPPAPPCAGGPSRPPCRGPGEFWGGCQKKKKEMRPRCYPLVSGRRRRASAGAPRGPRTRGPMAVAGSTC